MSNKLLPVALTLLAGAMVLGSVTQGCGGGSSTTGAAGTGGGAGTSGSGSAGAGSFTETCNKLCTKVDMCGLLNVATCKATICSGAIGTGAAGTTGAGSGNDCGGKSAAQQQNEFNACLNGACTTLFDCFDAVCPSATGRAGTGGGAGVGGAAGTGGGAGLGGILGAAGSAGSTCDTACVKADACCKALDPTDDCTYKMQCDEAGASSSTAVAICNGILQAAPFIKTPVPEACK